MKKKGREFWNYIERFDIYRFIGETWVEEKEWERMKKLSNNFFHGSVNIRKKRKREEKRKEGL